MQSIKKNTGNCLVFCLTITIQILGIEPVCQNIGTAEEFFVHSDTNHYYYAFDLNKDYVQAKAYCESYPDTHLVFLETVSEYRWFLDKLDEIYPNEDIIVGAEMDHESGKLYWMHGNQIISEVSEDVMNFFTSYNPSRKNYDRVILEDGALEQANKNDNEDFICECEGNTSELQGATLNDTTIAMEQTTIKDTTAPLEHTTTKSTTTVLRQTSKDITPALEQTTTEDTTPALEQTTTRDTTAALEQTTTENTTAALGQTTTENTAAALQQTTTEDTAADLEQTITRDTTAALEQTTTENTAAALQQATSKDTTAKLEQTTTRDTTAALGQTTTKDTTAPQQATTAIGTKMDYLFGRYQLVRSGIMAVETPTKFNSYSVLHCAQKCQASQECFAFMHNASFKECKLLIKGAGAYSSCSPPSNCYILV